MTIELCFVRPHKICPKSISDVVICVFGFKRGNDEFMPSVDVKVRLVDVLGVANVVVGTVIESITFVDGTSCSVVATCCVVDCCVLFIKCHQIS